MTEMRIHDLLLTDIPNLLAIVLLYVGPDQVLPLLSILASIVGVLLIWWRRLVGFVRSTWRSLSRRPRPARVESPAKLNATAAVKPSPKE